MNIFILDKDPTLSVIYHTDKHIVKMPIESTQILCTVLHNTHQAPDWAYKPTHKSHPCVQWASESLDNWRWLRNYALLLGNEYTYRYDKQHKSITIAQWLPEPNIPSIGLTPFAKWEQSMVSLTLKKKTFQTIGCILTCMKRVEAVLKA